MPDSFLPTTPDELRQRGWDQLDVILVTGDSYIDSPFIGAAVIGRVLEQAGYRVGIIAQPEIDFRPRTSPAWASRACSGASPAAASIRWWPTTPPARRSAARRRLHPRRGQRPPPRPGDDRLHQPDPPLLQKHRARWCWAASRPRCAGWRTTISGATACAARSSSTPKPITCSTAWPSSRCWSWRARCRPGKSADAAARAVLHRQRAARRLPGTALV